MKEKLTYVVLGSGGTGGPIGGFLAKAGLDVTMIARGRHLEAMREEGLKIRFQDESVTIPVKAMTTEEYQGTPDVIFVCVKGYSLDSAVSFIKKAASSDTVVIPILNIYGTGGKLQEALPGITVTDGCIYIAAEIEKPGTIRMSGRIFRVVYGLRKGTSDEVAKKVLPVLKKIESDLKSADILPIFSTCIERDALQKFSFVSPMAAIGACYGVDASAMQKGGNKRELFITLVREIQQIASAMEAGLPEDIVEINLKIMDDLVPTATASMQRDMEAGRQSEVDGLIYQVTRLGEKFHVDVPAYTAIAKELRERLKYQKYREEIEQYVTEHYQEAKELLMELGQIPAPSHMEERRAEYVQHWLLSQGAEDVTIDRAKNVVCKIGLEEHKEIVVFMAHLDIVFPDLEPLPMRQEGEKLYAPGIGDDTANLVNLLMGAKYLLEKKPKQNLGFLIVANSCEEGLGNLDGCKEIMGTYGDRVRAFYSFDGYLPQCTNVAVGSQRYKITVKTEGGHSWSKFGNTNAIAVISELVHQFYQMEVPTQARTTYNVGRIEGGTTVNSIAQEASILFEFRSTSQKCLKIMEKKMRAILESFCGDYEITAELLGVRPGNGDLDPEKLEAYTRRSTEIIKRYCREEANVVASSTDSNIPLSMGMPANTIGTVTGAKSHTREEWVDLESLLTGMKIVLDCMLCYTEEKQ